MYTVKTPAVSIYGFKTVERAKMETIKTSDDKKNHSEKGKLQNAPMMRTCLVLGFVGATTAFAPAPLLTRSSNAALHVTRSPPPTPPRSPQAGYWQYPIREDLDRGVRRGFACRGDMALSHVLLLTRFFSLLSSVLSTIPFHTLQSDWSDVWSLHISYPKEQASPRPPPLPLSECPYPIPDCPLSPDSVPHPFPSLAS